MYTYVDKITLCRDVTMFKKNITALSMTSQMDLH